MISIGDAMHMHRVKLSLSPEERWLISVMERELNLQRQAIERLTSRVQSLENGRVAPDFELTP